MPLTTNFQVSGVGEKRRAAVKAALAAALSERAGRWHVQFIGNRGDEAWEVRVSGPGVETSGLVNAGADAEELAAVVSAMAG